MTEIRDTTKDASPHRVVEMLISCVAAGDLRAAYALYAENAHVSVEFEIPGRKDLVGTGGWPVELPRMYDDIKVQGLFIHQTGNPDVVIAEWDYVSRIGTAEVVNSNIIVVQVQAGKIVRARDYHNHVARAIANGQADTLIAKIRSMVLPVDR